jgi:hypothetical protein
MREYIMKTTRKIGLLPVILVCAAFALVPLVAAAGPGQGNQGQGGFSQGPAHDGSMNKDQGGRMMPDNNQNANPGADHNERNTTAPRGPPGGDFGNMTGNMTVTSPGYGNMTALDNMTFSHPPMDGNWTAPDNRTISWHGDGNATPPQIPPDNGTSTGSTNQNGQNVTDGTQPGQPQNQDQHDSDLIAAFLKWLRGQ